MLSLLKKSGAQKAALQTIPWRPDFRDAASLPDTKTVRTAFFLNLVASAVAGGLLLYVAQRELAISSLRKSLDDLEARIAATRAGSEKAKVTFQQFRAEEAKFNEAFAFVRDPFRLQDFVLHLGSTLPFDVSVRRIDYRGIGQNLVVAGSVRGLDAAASDVASSFVQQLQTDPVLAVHFSAITLTNLGRNADEGSLNLELAFAFKGKPAPKGPVKK